MTTSLQRNSWLIFLVTGLVLGGMYAFASETVGYFLYYGVTLATVVALAIGPSLHRTRYRLPWYVLAAAMALNLLADLVWDGYRVLFELEAPNPSLADPIYIVSFVTAIVAFLLWSRAVNPTVRDRETSVDAAIVALGFGVLAWIFIIEPRIYEPGLSFAGQAVSLSYPVLDLFLLTVLIRILFRPQAGRQRAVLLMIAGVLCIILADALYSWGELTATYGALEYIADSGWMLWSVLWGAAALDPTIQELDRVERRVTAHSPGLTRGRFAILSLSTLVTPIGLLLNPLDGPLLGLLVVGFGSACLIGLIIYRMYLMVSSLEAAVHKQAELQRELEFAAFHDPLTGLANRALLNASLDYVVEQRRERAIALLFLDLDNFKEVNDQLGHAAGDRLLTLVSERLRHCIRPRDTIGRIGGDEFVILLRFEGESPLDTSIAVSNRILKALEEPFEIEREQARVGASIGIAWLGDDHVSVDSIMRAADRAMYDAKRAGKNRYSIAPVVADVSLREDERPVDLRAPLKFPHSA